MVASKAIASSAEGAVDSGGQVIVDKQAIASSAKGSANSNGMIMTGVDTIASSASGKVTNSAQMIVDTASVSSSVRGSASGLNSMMMAAPNTVAAAISGRADFAAQMIVSSGAVSSSVRGTASGAGSMMIAGSNTTAATVAGGATGGAQMMVDSGAVASSVRGTSSGLGSMMMVASDTHASNASGMAADGGLVMVQSSAIGSQISGRANTNSTLSVRPNSIGSLTAGLATPTVNSLQLQSKKMNPRQFNPHAPGPIIESSGCGSAANGCAMGNGSMIMVEDDVSGSVASGIAVDGGQIMVKTRSHGSKATGGAYSGGMTGPSMIVVGEDAEGSHVNGMAMNGGMIMVANGARGSIVSGVAYENELHCAMGEGSAVFGRNNIAGGAYSFATGCGAVANMFCSLAHSGGATGIVSGVTGGYCQVVRIVAGTSPPSILGPFYLGDGSFPSLPNPGFALCTIDIVGSMGSYISAKLIFKFIGGIYTFITFTFVSSSFALVPPPLIGINGPSFDLEINPLASPLPSINEIYCASMEFVIAPPT